MYRFIVHKTQIRFVTTQLKRPDYTSLKSLSRLIYFITPKKAKATLIFVRSCMGKKSFGRLRVITTQNKIDEACLTKIETK